MENNICDYLPMPIICIVTFLYTFPIPGSMTYGIQHEKKALHVHTWFKHPPMLYIIVDCVAEWKSPWKQGSWGQHGPIWGRQDQGGPIVGPRNFAIWVYFSINQLNSVKYHRFVVNHIKMVSLVVVWCLSYAQTAFKWCVIAISPRRKLVLKYRPHPWGLGTVSAVETLDVY